MVGVGTELAGRYELGDKIATGGMGAVFKATDLRLGRTVAIKVLRDDLAEDDRFVERFRREARAAAALSHPSIAGVFDYGQDAGCNFIVMEYVPGKDLARVLREDGRMPEERAARIAAQVCDALHHAHAAGVVHRDVKPANVMAFDGDRVKVTDFGIARAAGDATLTATGSVLGTAQYLSPEQASGERVTAASDVYSLGVVLYEMVTGSVPFTGDTPVAIAMRHVSEAMPAPSALNADVSGAMDEIVRRATAKSPADRFTDAAEMKRALEDAVGADTAPLGGPTAAIPAPGATRVLERDDADRPVPLPVTPWDPYRLGRAVLIVFAALALIAALLLIVRLAARDDTVPPPAETRRERTDRTTPASQLITVPADIIGLKEKDAADRLQSLDLVPAVEKRQTDDVPKDIVFDVQPEEGSRVAPGTTVTLFVSEGEKDEDDGNGRGRGRRNGNGKGKGKADD